MKTARWRHWLDDDQEVRLWYENLERGSPVTADETIRVLYRYLTRFNLTPAQLVELARKDLRSLENQFLSFIAALEKEEKAPNYIHAHLKAVKSYLNHHNIPLTRRFNIKNIGSTPTLEDERVPTRDELRAILSSATPRGRVIVSLMAFSGVRPEVLGGKAPACGAAAAGALQDSRLLQLGGVVQEEGARNRSKLQSSPGGRQLLVRDWCGAVRQGPHNLLPGWVGDGRQRGGLHTRWGRVGRGRWGGEMEVLEAAFAVADDETHPSEHPHVEPHGAPLQPGHSGETHDRGARVDRQALDELLPGRAHDVDFAAEARQGQEVATVPQEGDQQPGQSQGSGDGHHGVRLGREHDLPVGRDSGGLPCKVPARASLLVNGE